MNNDILLTIVKNIDYTLYTIHKDKIDDDIEYMIDATYMCESIYNIKVYEINTSKDFIYRQNLLLDYIRYRKYWIHKELSGVYNILTITDGNSSHYFYIDIEKPNLEFNIAIEDFKLNLIN